MNYFLRPTICIGLIAACLSFSKSGMAQTDSIRTKKFDHFISVQANPLIRQVFNFSQSDDIENPYLLNYSMKNRVTGFTYNLGLGFGTENREIKDGPESSSSSYDIRAGLGYQIEIVKNLEVGIGGDVIWGQGNRESFSSNVINSGPLIDSTFASTTNKVNKYGFGISSNIRFLIGKHLTVGTYFSIDYVYSKTKRNFINERHIIATDPNFENSEQTTISTFNEEEKSGATNINLPVAFFIGFKF